MRLLVTGVNGLVGSRVCAQAQFHGHEVLGVCRGPRRSPMIARYESLDLTDLDAVRTALCAFAPEAVIHAAGMSDVDACAREPAAAHAANVTASTYLATVAGELGAHLVHVSTDYVFDGEAGPYGEEDAPSPQGVYAQTKLAAEASVRSLLPNAAIARTAVVYGWPTWSRPNFGSWLVQSLRQGKQVPLFEDQQISPTFVESAAEMLLELSARRLQGVWNTCGADVLSRVAFGHALCEVFGFSPALLVPTRMADVALSAPRPKRAGLKCDKVRAQLRAKPLALYPALEAFRRTVEESP